MFIQSTAPRMGGTSTGAAAELNLSPYPRISSKTMPGSVPFGSERQGGQGDGAAALPLYARLLGRMGFQPPSTPREQNPCHCDREMCSNTMRERDSLTTDTSFLSSPDSSSSSSSSSNVSRLPSPTAVDVAPFSHGVQKSDSGGLLHKSSYQKEESLLFLLLLEG